MASVEIRHSPCLGSEKGKVSGVRSREITPVGSPCMLRDEKKTLSCSKDTIDEELHHAMSMRLVSSGSYNVRASEMAHYPPDRQPKVIPCIVHFLDDSSETFEVDKRAKAQHLLDKVFEHLELIEKDYFGLQFIDMSPDPDTMDDGLYENTVETLERWLDPLKTIKKQCRGPNYEFYFRVKFYVTDPSKLAEEYTRYHFFLQVKRDIVEGRLHCPRTSAALLASFSVQSEMGDFNKDEHIDGYLSEFHFIPSQDEEFEKEVAKHHQSHRGQTPADAEYNYLDKAKRLEMYGVDLHKARDQSNLEIQLGVTSVGLVVFQNNLKINTFPWSKIVKISFKRKQFFIQLRREQNDNVENLIGFNMISYRSCKNMWKSCVEHHTFFRLHTPSPPSRKMFSLGSKFRYRSPSKRYARRTVGGNTRNVILVEKNTIDGYRNIPKSKTFSGSTSAQNSSSSQHSFHRGVNHHQRATLPHDYKLGTSSQNSLHSEKSDDDGGFLAHNANKDAYPAPIPTKKVNFTANGAAITDANHNTGNNICDLPVYNECIFMTSDYAKQNGGNLSQDSETTGYDPQKAPVETRDSSFGERSKQIFRVTAEDKSSNTMKDDEQFEKFVRPRSFSDTSLSNSDNGYLKALRDKIQGWKNPDLLSKTSLKVFVRRETEKVTDADLKRTKLDDDGGFRKDLSNQKAIFTRSRSTDFLDNDRDVPPPKPKLPENFKLHVSQSTAIQYSSDYARIEESKRQFSQTGSSSFDYQCENRADYAKVDANNPGRRHPRLSDSDLPVRRSSFVYRYKDPKAQTELLQKELNKLRSSEHVKKQSEAVKQLLTGETKPNSKGNRVRFSGDFTHVNQKVHEEQNTQADLNKNGAKKILKQSKSVDYNTAKPKPVDDTNHQPVHNNSCLLSFSYPLSGTKQSFKDSSKSAQDVNITTKDLAQKLKDDLDKELLEPRRGLNLQRGQGQIRSKSESVLNRTSMQRSKSSVAEYGKLNIDQKNAPFSRSTSNLRRKYDTITKSNYFEIEKKRERVRANFERKKTIEKADNIDDSEDVKQSRLKSKFDTIRKYNNQDIEQKRERVRENYLRNWRKLLDQQSDDEDDGLKVDDAINKVGNSIKSSDAVYIDSVAIDRSGRSVSRPITNTQSLPIPTHVKQNNIRPDKLVSDNRSDEEKYAALSRYKIVHSKSSSLDSKHQLSDVDLNKTEKVNKKFGVMGISSVRHENTLKSSSGLLKNSFNELNIHRDTQEPHSDSETILKSSKVQIPKGDIKPKLVVRQCRIGTSVAFGLVGVAQSEPNGNGYLDGQGLVTIRMIPDEQGRFGFNVKGGADQGMPIIVSRVAPNTPADNAIPRLNEGDQVLYINGRDVSQHTHEQVVMFIRASRETHSGELVLKVRPNAYSAEDNCDEPDLTYDPETHQISSATGGANALDLSLKLLEESLESGAALAQFEQLYRKKPGMTMNAARLEINIPKNRYRDISPYDQTRVIMKNNPSGDYINANYVNMEIPVSGIVNRYIAAQGPLPTTCIDFWQMIWEQQSTLVVMLTTKVERGRIKCHQYWPDLYETSDYGHLQITCVKEEESSVFAFREFNLTHVELQEERHISHMQYIAWPDHGVPDDPVDFLEFVTKVRQKRVGIVEPIIVHCSAGIGRTGVLITMETAMCLTEANQPVYPLSIVRQMRDQRAMLIQTPNQYKFVCEAIIRAYNEGIVKPLPEYSQR